MENELLKTKQPCTIHSVNYSGLFGIFNKTIINLSLIDRIRVLFGKEIRVLIHIDVDKEVDVKYTSAKTIVDQFFPKHRFRKNESTMQSIDSCS